VAGGNGNGSGAAGDRSPMLLLHGFTGTPVMWDPVLPLLELHHECHAITLPGHHGGPEMVDDGLSIVDSFVERVERQMDELGLERAHIVGNSLGGALSLELASRGRAISTVAISPAGGWEVDSAEARRLQLFFRMLHFQTKHFKGLAHELVIRPRGRMLALRDAVAAPGRLPAPLAAKWIEAAADTPCFEMLIAHAPTFNVEKTIEPFDSPLRIVWGTRDRILPFDRYAAVIDRHLPHAEWVMLDGVGHVPMSDDPAGVAQAILEFTTAPATARAADD
jgi:pimeloyl-ACP methyl ester carboxylesterase